MSRYLERGTAASLAAALCLATGAGAGPGPCTLGPGECQLPDQAGHGTGDAVGATSDANPDAGFAVQDNLVIGGGAIIDTVCWWGTYVEFPTPADCGPGTVPDAFTITYFDNVPGFPGRPGAVRAGPFVVTPSKAPTGNAVTTQFGDLTEYEYSATHPNVAVGNNECVWIEIRNDTSGSSPTCLWLWSTSPSVAEGGIGDAVSWQSDVPWDFDMAFCVNGTLGDPTLCQPVINTGCTGAQNTCQQTSPAPGCQDQECCTLVCEQLPFCCFSGWSQQCVDVANEICSECGEPQTGDCYAANFTPYCNDRCDGQPCIGCCDTVCAVDPFCCGADEGDWDGFCAFEAQQLCGCPAGGEPANDDCSGAMLISLGDTLFDNTCATPGPPNHATCTDGALTGLGLDLWYTYQADFTGQLLVSTCNQALLDTQLAVYDGCDCQALSDPPLGCNDDGAVCGGGTSLVVVDVTVGNCYTIRVGSAFQNPLGAGTLTLSATVPEPCEITIPPVAVGETEPCGDNANGGCDNNPQPPFFTTIQIGDLIHGTAWASGGLRDTDWYQLVVTETMQVELEIEAEFPFVVGFAETDPPGSGNCGDHTGFVVPSASGDTCTTASVIAGLEPGTWWPFVAPAVGDGLPCPVGVAAGNDYTLEITIPCPWDCGDGDGEVSIEDVFALFAEWGLEDTPCDLGIGEPGAGIEEFFAMLGHWGTCP